MYSSIGIVIPCYQASKDLPQCLPPLLNSPLKPKILIIDSSSTDSTVPIAKQMGVETLIIPQKEFNHGTTREMGRRHLQTSIIVMLTQDAYAVSHDTLGTLVKPLIEKRAAVSYARQVPHPNANILASFHRKFNYPEESQIRSLADVEKYGAYTFFCSNSCAAYLNSALEEIEGFRKIEFGEDTIAAAQLLNRGYKIAYVAEAIVRHSHDYSLRQEFHRHFLMGVARKRHQDLLGTRRSDQRRGSEYVYTLLKELWQSAPFQIPYALLQTLVKYCGYMLGTLLHKSPLSQ